MASFWNDLYLSPLHAKEKDWKAKSLEGLWEQDSQRVYTGEPNHLRLPNQLKISYKPIQSLLDIRNPFSQSQT